MFPNRLLSPDNPIDDDDLQFLDDDERNAELGLEPPAPITSLPYDEPSPLVARAIQPPERAPLVGALRWRLAEVARARGVMNREGSHRGKVSLSGLARGSGLAHTTVKRILAHPDDIDMIATETMIRLCYFLKCQPGDLLIYTSGRSPNHERQNTADTGRN